MKDLKVGIQLYSLRDEMKKDMDATLKSVAEMGYKYVEFAGFFDKKAEDVKAMLDKYGLTAISVHQGIDPYLREEDGKALVEYLKVIGVKYSVIPWMNKDVFHNEEQYAKFVENVKKVGAMLKENGITQCYHNHDFEFDKVGDKYVLDRLYDDVSQDLLMTELDLCWVKYGGEDPVKYVNKYAKRSGIIHFKDFYAKGNKATVYALIDENGNEIKKAPSKEENEFKFMPLGQGLQNWAPIVEAVKESDVEYVIYEKDQWYDGDALADAKASRDYLKNTFGI